jgi:hypothetical protein
VTGCLAQLRDGRKSKPAAYAMVVQRIASIVVLLCFALAGCAAVQQRHERMHATLNPYIGRTIADYALDHGPPTNIVDLGPGKKGFQWLATETCTVSITAHATKPDPALSDWVIEHWRWQGKC